MPSITKESAEQFWQLCTQYLNERTDIIAVRELAAIENREAPDSLECYYRRLLESLKNRQGVPNTIGDVGRLGDVLCNFSPKNVRARYGTDWEQLFSEIQQKVRPTSRMDRKVRQSYWCVFSKGALDGASFLAQFETANGFKNQVDVFAQSIAFRPGLPQLLAIEIHGFGFALACDFLKESGWSQYAKPDVHTKAILKEVGFCDGKDYDTFKAMQAIAH